MRFFSHSDANSKSSLSVVLLGMGLLTAMAESNSSSSSTGAERTSDLNISAGAIASIAILATVCCALAVYFSRNSRQRYARHEAIRLSMLPTSLEEDTYSSMRP